MKKINDEINKCGTKAVQKTELGLEKTFVFPLDFEGFQGHFPNNPILPAVIQVMVVREAIAEHLGHEINVTRVLNAKFLQIIHPNIPITVIWNVKEQEDTCDCKCIIEMEGSIASKILLTFKSK